MKNINITVMGKTGAGKSTLINAVFGEELAPTGIGQAITKKNTLYSKKMLLPIGENKNGTYSLMGCMLNMYDTVGLEIDNVITETTLSDIKKRLEETKVSVDSDDIHVVWFCVNSLSRRFEPYELNLIRDLSINYEIPFIIVLTQSYSDEEEKLEVQIRNQLREVSRCRVLAKDYSMRIGEIKAYGITELIQKSFFDYEKLKVKILERKLNELDECRKARIKEIEKLADLTISYYVSKSEKIGCVPALCIPFVHGICAKMIAQLNRIAGFKGVASLKEEILTDVLVGIIWTPRMVIPGLSKKSASVYVAYIGENYLKVMLDVIHLSSDKELENTNLVSQRIKGELSKLKNMEVER